MALATLSIDLVAKLASLEAGLDKAGRLAEKNADRIDRAFSGLKVAAAGLGGVIAGAFSVSAIDTFFRATVDGLDRLNDLKDATGSSIENISALEDVALRTGSSFESVSTALVKLNNVLKEAKAGSSAAETLKAIGLSAEELKRIDPAEAMLKVAQALSGFADDGNKARITQELFGKSIQEVAPLLKDLAEKGKLNATVTTAQAQAAEDFNKALAGLSKTATDLTRGPMADLLTSLTRAMERWKELGALGAIQFNMSRAPNPASAIGRMLSGNSPFDNELTEFQRARDELAKKRAELSAAKPSTGFFGTSNEAFREGLKQEIADLEKQVKLRGMLIGLESGAGAGRGGKAPALPSAPDVPEALKKTKEKKEKGDFIGPLLPESRKDALDAIDASMVAQSRKITEAVAELNAVFASGAIGADDFNSALEKLRGKDVFGPEPSESVKRLNELLAATPTSQLADARDEMKLLADALESGAISAEQFTEAAQARLGTLPENFKKATDEMTVFAEEAGRNIQDALGDTIFDTLSGDFDNIGDRWKTLLQRMASEAMAAQIGKALFGDFGKTNGGSAGDLFGALAGMFAGAGGGAGTISGGSGMSIPSYDVGTPFVPQDTLALVHKGERIIPAAQNRPGARNSGRAVSVAYNPTIYVDSRTDQAQVAKIAADINAEGQRQLIDSLRAQGVLH